MFVIYGSMTSKRRVGKGHFFCPSCSVERTYYENRLTEYLVLFFIPVFNKGDRGTMLECAICHNEYEPQVLRRQVTTLPEPRHRLSEGEIKCPSCSQTSRLDPAQKQRGEFTCPSCGASWPIG